MTSSPFPLTHYLLSPSLSFLPTPASPLLTRPQIMTAFINYCLQKNLMDLRNHSYEVGKCEKLRVVLGYEKIEARMLWRVLRRWVVVVNGPKGVEFGEQEVQKAGLRIR